MNNPKFCVGEEVMVRGIVTSDYDTNKTEVIESKYFNGLSVVRVDGGESFDGWRYKTAHQPDKSLWWREGSLRKLPKRKENSFKSIMSEFIGIEA